MLKFNSFIFYFNIADAIKAVSSSLVGLAKPESSDPDVAYFSIRSMTIRDNLQKCCSGLFTSVIKYGLI